MVDVLQEQPDAQILLETHSEVLLYEALLQAAGDLQDDVSLTWLDSAGGNGTRVQPVGLDPSGRPTDDALRRSFSALGALRREVIEARRHHAS
jgi:hypothetical protein